MPSAATTPGFIYFVRATDGMGPIKIGFTTNLAQRLKCIQAYSPVPLEYVAYFKGISRNETTLHHLFRDHRLHFEWFDPVPELLAIVAQHAGALEGDVHEAEEDQAVDIAFNRFWHRANDIARLNNMRNAAASERQKPFRRVA